MEVDKLVRQLEQLPGAAVGRGPQHPEDPDSSNATAIEGFLAQFPSLRSDTDYVEFLEKYAGARIENEDYTQLVDIYGFTDASVNMYDTDGGELVADGYLTFAQCVYHLDATGRPDTYQYDFAFDVSGTRPGIVYRRYTAMYESERPFTPHLDNFHSWLEELIRNEGRYEKL